MGGHNRTCRSLRWVGLDDEQICVRDTRDLKFEVLKTSNLGHRTIVFLAHPRVSLVGNSAGPGPVMRRSGGFDSSKRAGIRCRTVPTVIVYSAKEECDVAGDAMKVEDATWDAEVIKASELVMVDFWAVWCGPCQMVAPVIEELSKEYAGKMKVRKLNTDENPEVAGRYQVMSIPTILFFKNGQVVEKLVGARPKRQFKDMIDSLLAQPAGSA